MRMGLAARLLLPVAVAATVIAGSAAMALQPLGQNSYVTDRLVAARVADRIRKTCPDRIGARLLYAFSQAYALRNWAIGQGYPAAEVDRFIKDKTEKQKIYAAAEDYLAAHGAKGSDVEGFCTLGQKEIAAKSIAGSLIYQK